MSVATLATSHVTSSPSRAFLTGGGVSDQFLTIAELADRLGKQPQTIHKYRTDSKPGRKFSDQPFPEPDRTVGTMPLWNAGRLPEIKAWVASRRITGRPRKPESGTERS